MLNLPFQIFFQHSCSKKAPPSEVRTQAKETSIGEISFGILLNKVPLLLSYGLLQCCGLSLAITE